jgi:hypothetical protein
MRPVPSKGSRLGMIPRITRAVWLNPIVATSGTQQPVRVEVWSEKGTVRGVLAPVLDHYAVGFRVMHGFASATAVHDVAEDYDGRDLVVLYVGDFDPSGLFMSEEDLPNRIAEYGGDHVELRRIAVTRKQAQGLPSFPAADKKKEPWCSLLGTRRDGPE